MAEDQKKRGLPFYYPVASVLLLLLVVGFGISGLWGVIRLAFPSVTAMDYEYRRTATFDEFVQNGRYMRHGDRYVETAGGDTLTRQEVEVKREDARKNQLAEERHGGLQQVLLGLIGVGVGLPLYLYHHRVVQRARRISEEGP